MKKISLLFASSILAILMTSCGGNNASKSSDSNSDEQSAIFAYPIPTTFEVTEMLNKAGASYIISVTNDVNNMDRYVTSTDQALNLGVYSADLCYASSYNMKQDLLNFLNVTKMLMENLQINIPANQTIVDELENAGENKDSILIVITETIQQTYHDLKANGREDISLLVMAGSFIESLYISVQIANISSNNGEIMKVIAGQKVTLNELLKLMEPYQKSDNLQSIYTQLAEINSFYSKITMSIDENQLAEITNLVERIRTDVVN